MFGSRFGLWLGFLLGSIFCLLSYTAASIPAFLMARYCCKRRIRERLIESMRVFRAIDASFEKEGLKLAILLRVSPLIPRNSQVYVMAATNCTLKHFVIGTLLGILPGMLSFCFIGCDLKSISEVVSGAHGIGIELISGLVMLCLLIVLLRMVMQEAKKQLNRILERQEQVAIGEHGIQVAVSSSPSPESSDEA